MRFSTPSRPRLFIFDRAVCFNPVQIRLAMFDEEKAREKIGNTKRGKDSCPGQRNIGCICRTLQTRKGDSFNYNENVFIPVLYFFLVELDVKRKTVGLLLRVYISDLFMH